MAQIIFLNDIVAKERIWSRYLGPYPLVSLIKKNTEKSVVLIDFFTKIENFFIYIDEFIDHQTELICMSTTFLNLEMNADTSRFSLWHETELSAQNWFMQLRSLLKKKKSKAKIVVGGHSIDVLFKKYALKELISIPDNLKNVDFFVHGYAEQIILDIVNNRIRSQTLFEKNGLTFLSDGSRAGQNAIVVENSFDHTMGIQNNEWLPIEIAKGCKFSCKFCFYDNKGSTPKNIDLLRSELIRNYEYFGTTGYILTDDTINDSREKIENLHTTFSKLPFKIEWISYARPDMFFRYPETIDAIFEIGARGLFLGIETLSHKAGMIAGKGLHPDKIKYTLEKLSQKAKSRCFLLGSFIIGLVGETEASLNKTLSYLKTQTVLDMIQYEILFVREQDRRMNSEI
jgi:radical SAM superfamily enzyme YgiQ (UPF0313 family)